MDIRVQTFAAQNGIRNVFQYAMAEEVCVFEKNAEEIGYNRKTTFYSDLSIAEWYGLNSVKETYDNVVKSWLKDVVYFTEFCLSLNWKAWEWSGRGHDELTDLYTDLYYKARDLALDTFKEDDLHYFLETLD